jgi:hypothetical protein
VVVDADGGGARAEEEGNEGVIARRR